MEAKTDSYLCHSYMPWYKDALGFGLEHRMADYCHGTQKCHQAVQQIICQQTDNATVIWQYLD